MAPRATTASAAAPKRSGPMPPPTGVGDGLSCTATPVGDADAVSEGAATGDALALGAAVVGCAVGASVGGAVGVIVGGAVGTGVGGAVGGAVGWGVVSAWTTIVPCMNVWMAQWYANVPAAVKPNEADAPARMTPRSHAPVSEVEV